MPIHPLTNSRDLIQYICPIRSVDWRDNNGGFRSYLDFNDADIQVTFLGKPLEYELRVVHIDSKRRRMIVADKFRKCAEVGQQHGLLMPCFTGKTVVK